MKDSEFKESLGNKKKDNVFTDIKIFFKITYKVNKIKLVQDTVKKE